MKLFYLSKPLWLQKERMIVERFLFSVVLGRYNFSNSPWVGSRWLVDQEGIWPPTRAIPRLCGSCVLGRNWTTRSEIAVQVVHVNGGVA